MEDRKIEVTRILRKPGGGVQEELFPLVYDELRAIARNRMAGERANHTLQATALVNEAFVRLVDEEMSWRDRKHFYSAAAESMRRILIDHARKVKSLKRGGDRQRVTLGAPEASMELEAEDLIGISEALDRLAAEDPLAADVTRLRFFSGLSVEDTAQILQVSERTVYREWTYARARLFEFLGDGTEPA